MSDIYGGCYTDEPRPCNIAYSWNEAMYLYDQMLRQDYVAVDIPRPVLDGSNWKFKQLFMSKETLKTAGAHFPVIKTKEKMEIIRKNPRAYFVTIDDSHYDYEDIEKIKKLMSDVRVPPLLKSETQQD